MGYSNKNKEKTEVVTPAQKFGSVNDLQQYNPFFSDTTRFLASGVGSNPTESINEFMSGVAPQISSYFTSQQSPLMSSLSAQAGDLASQAAANQASQYSGLNALYSRGANENIASAIAQPFANVQNQLGMQALNLSGSTLNNALSNYMTNENTRLSGLTSLSSPYFYDPYTYQGEQRASTSQGSNFLSGALGGASVGSNYGLGGTAIGGILGGLGGLFF